MAKAAESAMDRGLLKRLLSQSTDNPVKCAFGMTKEGAQILVDKIKGPKALEKDLLKLFPDITNTRFGEATLAADDVQLLRVDINRAIGGGARRVAKALKGTGIKRIELLVDGQVVESAADEEQAASADEGQTAAQEAPPLPIDKQALEHRLAGLIQRVQSEADPKVKADLAKLAMAANAQLKAGDLEAASMTVNDLAGRLETQAAPRANPAAPGGDGAAVKVAKGLLVWNSTRSYAEQQLNKLSQAVLDMSGDEADFDDIKANIGQINGLMELLDDGLTKQLNELRGTQDPQQKIVITQQTRDLVKQYQQKMESDPLMAVIDENGFIPLDVKAKVTAALNAVLTTI